MFQLSTKDLTFNALAITAALALNTAAQVVLEKSIGKSLLTSIPGAIIYAVIVLFIVFMIFKLSVEGHKRDNNKSTKDKFTDIGAMSKQKPTKKSSSGYSFLPYLKVIETP